VIKVRGSLVARQQPGNLRDADTMITGVEIARS
jgi:hypothetical protein